MGIENKPSYPPNNLPPDPTETYGPDTQKVLRKIQELKATSTPKSSGADESNSILPTQWANLDLKVLNVAAEFEKAAGKPKTETADSISGSDSFTLHSPVAWGGFAEIWEATQEPLRRLIAIKRLRSDLLEEYADQPAKTKAIAEVFYQEALTTANLQHPNIIPVHDLGIDKQGRPLIAMNLMRGQPWSSVIKADWNLPPWEFFAKHVPILINVAQAVAYAHTQGVVHRDLKPAQVMIGEFGEVVVMDWGLAVLVDHPETAAKSGPTDKAPLFERFTQTASSPAGTPSYMAPEQTQTDMRKIGPWTDVYLLGGILYYLLTGSPPHSDSNSDEAFKRASVGMVAPPADKAPDRDNPRELAALVMKALAPDPQNRVASVLEFIAALKDYLSGASVRREAEALLDDVERHMDDIARNYHRLAESLSSLARAEGLWRGNTRIAPLREKVRETYARLALERGDLSMARVQAERLSDPDTRRQLLGLADKAQHKIEKTARERKVYLFAAAFFVALLAFGVWRYINDQRESVRRAEKAEQAALEQKALAEESADQAQTARIQAESEQYLASINSAFLYLKKGSTQLSKNFLTDHTPQWTRGWEWHYLMRLTNMEERILHEASINFEVYDAKFSPDGLLIAGGDRSGTVMVWDAKTGRQLNSRKVHDRGIWSIHFSPDSQFILTASLDSTAAILNAGTLNTRVLLRGHTNYQRGAAWSRDGRHVATTSRDGTVRIWLAETGQQEGVLTYPANLPYDVDFHPNGEWVGVASLARFAAIVSWRTGEIVKELEGHTGNVRTIEFSRDGTRVATGAGSDQVRVFDSSTGDELSSLPVGDCTPNDVAFSPDGRLLAMNDGTGNARIWDWEKRELLGTLYTSLKGWSVAFSSDGERLLTVSDREIRTWRLGDVTFHAEPVPAVAVPDDAAPEHFRVISLPMDRGSVWFNRDTPWIEGEWKKYYRKQDRWYRADSFYHIAHPTANQRIEIGYNLSEAIVHFDGTDREPLYLRHNNTYSAVFSRDGRLAATGSLAGEVEVWNTSDWSALGRIQLKESPIGAIQFDPEGRQLLTGQADGALTIIDLETMKSEVSFQAHQKLILGITFNHAGTQMVTASSDKTAKIWDVSSWELLHELIGHQEVVLTAEFSPDDTRVLTGSFDGTAQLWDAESGAPLLIVHDRERGEILTAATFSRNGEEILVMNTDGDLWVHRINAD